MVSHNIIKYLGKKHSYNGINCITILASFYKNELKSDVFDSLFDLIKKDEKIINTRKWMKTVSLSDIDRWASTCAKKVTLTTAKNYDVIVFRSLRGDVPIHFGMYIDYMRMFHLEEGAHSMITNITNAWSSQIHAIYRKMV